jgi:hypothetical protein
MGWECHYFVFVRTRPIVESKEEKEKEKEEVLLSSIGFQSEVTNHPA